MREQPRDTAESAQEQYEKLLAQSVAVHAEYQTMGNMIRRLYGEGRGDEAGPLSTQWRQLDRQLNDLMKQRVALVREIEHVKTIEDVFPRVRPLTKAEKVEMIATQILSAFDAGSISHAEVQLAAEKAQLAEEKRQLADEKLWGRKRSEYLSDEEYKAFCAARASLARELGYEVGYESKTAAENEKPSSWMMLRKDGVRFELKHDAFPGNSGIMGNSRISKLHVSTGHGGARGEEVVSHLSYLGDWHVACTDQKVQRDIDRVAAIFA